MSAGGTPFTTYVIEDDAGVSRSLCALLESHGYAAEPYGAAETFLDRFDPARKAGIILDLRLPGMGGMELLEQLNDAGIRTPVVIVTAHGDVPLAVKAMRGGAIDFIEKPPEADQLLNAVRSAEASMLDIPVQDVPKAVVAERLKSLTDREREVLGLLLQGKLNKKIADDLGISRRTVEVHRSRIKEKMHARGIADLIRMTR